MLKAGIRRQTIANKFVPVVGGSAFKNKGVQYLVDAVIDYLPSPLDIPPASRDGARHARARWRRRRTTTEISARSLSNFGAIRSSASWFSSASIPVRLSKGDTVYNPRTNKRERISASDSDSGRQARRHRHLLLGRHRGDRRHQEHHDGRHACATRIFPILLEPPSFPDPVISMAIEPKTKLDQEKMGDRAAASLRRRSDFQSFHARRHRPDDHRRNGRAAPGDHPRPHVPRIQGGRERGQAADRLSRDDHRQPADGEGKLIKQSGGRGQYGHVIVKVQPNERGKGITIENKVVGGNIPEGIHPGLQEGHRRSDAQRRGRRLSGDRRERRHRRRLVSRRRFERNGVQAGGDFCGEGRFQEGEADPARADHEGRERDPGRISGRHHGRFESPPRQDRQHRSEGKSHDGAGRSSAGGNVRLRHRDPFAFQGPFELLDGAVTFRTSARSNSSRPFSTRRRRSK